MQLEYRLDDPSSNYPAIWNYQTISKPELICRMTCDYFVKNGKTYETQATSIEPNGMAVMFVKEVAFTNLSGEAVYTTIGLEIKEVIKKNQYSLIERQEFNDHAEVIEYLHADFIYIRNDEKNLEFKLDSREIDDDRKCYVYYGNFTGFCLEK